MKKMTPQLLILIGALLLFGALTMLGIGELVLDDPEAQLPLRVAAGADLVVGLGFLFFGLRRLGERSG